MPERAKARRADWAPGPGVLVLFPQYGQFSCQNGPKHEGQTGLRDRESWSCFLNTANFHARTGQSTKGRLGSGTGSLGPVSSIRPIFMPERAKARRADWAPGPGVLVL